VKKPRLLDSTKDKIMYHQAVADPIIVILKKNIIVAME